MINRASQDRNEVEGRVLTRLECLLDVSPLPVKGRCYKGRGVTGEGMRACEPMVLKQEQTSSGPDLLMQARLSCLHACLSWALQEHSQSGQPPGLPFRE